MPPLRMRVLWWTMVKAEQLAQWCRTRWLAWHKTRGAVLPDDTPPPR